MNINDIVKNYNFNIIALRWAAWWLDSIFFAVVFVAIVGVDVILGPAKNVGLVFSCWVVFIIMYQLLFEGLTGYTIGKWCLRIKVVDEVGKPPGISKSSIRFVLKLFEANPLLIGGIIAGIVAWISSKKQRIGDQIAKTYVVRIKDLKKPRASGFSEFLNRIK